MSQISKLIFLRNLIPIVTVKILCDRLFSIEITWKKCYLFIFKLLYILLYWYVYKIKNRKCYIETYVF